MGSLWSGKPADYAGLSPSQVGELHKELEYFQMPDFTHDVMNKYPNREISNQETLDVAPFMRPAMRWDANRCHESLSISNNGRTITSNNRAKLIGVLGVLPDAPIFRVCIEDYTTIRVGYAKGQSFTSDNFNVDMGWFLCSVNCTVPRTSRCYFEQIQNNSVITFYFDKEASTISMAVNDVNFGCVFTSVVNDEGALFPCLYLSNGVALLVD